MEFLQELFFTVALSVVASFIIAKLLSVASACNVPLLLLSKSSICEKMHDQNSVVSDVESEKRLALSEESPKVNDLEEKKEFKVEKVDNDEVEVSGLREMNIYETVCKEEEEDVSVGGDEVAEQVSSSNIVKINDSASQSSDETPKGPKICEIEIELVKDKEKDHSLDDKGVMRNERHEVNNSEEDGWFDDWEGIERTDLEKRFGAAVSFVDSKSNADRLLGIDKDVKMELYGLHKVATEGPCCEPQPMALKVSARAKWNAWKQRADMSPEEAMEQYVALLSTCVPDLIGDNTSEDHTIEFHTAEHEVIGVEGPNLVNKTLQPNYCWQELQ